MPDVAAASALLTAESLVVAALSVGVQRISDLEGRKEQIAKRFALMLGLLVAISFLGALAYLHMAEFPDGYVGSNFQPNLIFNVTIGSLLALLYFGFGSVLMTATGYYDRILVDSAPDEKEEST